MKRLGMVLGGAVLLMALSGCVADRGYYGAGYGYNGSGGYGYGYGSNGSYGYNGGYGYGQSYGGGYGGYDRNYNYRRDRNGYDRRGYDYRR